jgi:hypothetical protein
MQAHPTIFKSSEIGTELSTYASVHKDALEKKFEEAHDFSTSVRGIKVREHSTPGRRLSDTSRVRQQDPNFDIFICEIGKWCPWNPCAGISRR